MPEGFEFEFFCSQGNGTSLEVCEATVGQWKEYLGLEPWIDSTQYSSRRPTMLGRQLHVPWMTRWGPHEQAAAPGRKGRNAAGRRPLASSRRWLEPQHRGQPLVGESRRDPSAGKGFA